MKKSLKRLRVCIIISICVGVTLIGHYIISKDILRFTKLVSDACIYYYTEHIECKMLTKELFMVSFDGYGADLYTCDKSDNNALIYLGRYSDSDLLYNNETDDFVAEYPSNDGNQSIICILRYDKEKQEIGILQILYSKDGSYYTGNILNVDSNYHGQKIMASNENDIVETFNTFTISNITKIDQTEVAVLFDGMERITVDKMHPYRGCAYKDEW